MSVLENHALGTVFLDTLPGDDIRNRSLHKIDCQVERKMRMGVWQMAVSGAAGGAVVLAREQRSKSRLRRPRRAAAHQCPGEAYLDVAHRRSKQGLLCPESSFSICQVLSLFFSGNMEMSNTCQSILPAIKLPLVKEKKRQNK